MHGVQISDRMDIFKVHREERQGLDHKEICKLY